MTTPPASHTESETNPWSIHLLDHAARADSPPFTAAKATFNKLMATLAGKEPYGLGPWQAHHGGSLWVNDGKGWLLFLNQFGIEWSLQFLADPAKVEILRQNAAAIVAAFPATPAAYAALGDKHSMEILATPIVDAATIGVYVDSIWNSCVPLASAVHVGIISAKNPTGGGIHHYPVPIWAGEFIKHPDYVFWVTDPASGLAVAVSPTAPKGSGVATVKVEYAAPHTTLGKAHQAAHDAGKMLILPADNTLAVQAFANQVTAPSPPPATPTPPPTS